MPTIADRFSRITARWERLSTRERSLITGLVGVFALMLSGAFVYVVWSSLSEIDQHNAATRQALKDIAQNREAFLENRRRMAAQETRIGSQPVQLSSMIEQAATDADVKIDESNERTPTPRGKKFVEKGMDVKIRKVPLDKLAKFMRRIETGPHLVTVDRLLIRTRYNEHDQLDVELGVSTYEHAPEAPKKPGAGENKADKT
jgi:type II secretory pathway component PulM